MYTAMLRYYDPQTDATVVHRDAELIYSGNGRTAPAYHEVYRLADGNYLSGVRHQGEDTVLTDICYSSTRAGALARHHMH
jgi:hypothetical protein